MSQRRADKYARNTGKIGEVRGKGARASDEVYYRKCTGVLRRGSFD